MKREPGYYWVKLNAPYSEGWYIGEWHNGGWFSFTWDMNNTFDEGDPEIIEINETRIKNPDEA